EGDGLGGAQLQPGRAREDTGSVRPDQDKQVQTRRRAPVPFRSGGRPASDGKTLPGNRRRWGRQVESSRSDRESRTLQGIISGKLECARIRETPAHRGGRAVLRGAARVG